ncbi:hypothetical protein ACFFNY_19635 [Paenibacillus hodogayensis]|uniref:Copper amine oxidase-like N-terminal domain-containing protein n=1 Tax=Paenibacillus hodogayensis TaxID=279208 RepID=A0ABV5W0L3_9BACL
MNHRIRIWMLVLAVAWSAAVFAPIAEKAGAAGTSVRVSVTNDPVRMNGQLTDQIRAKYPLITYKGITYLPLAWDNAEALGIRLEWDEQAGLRITAVPEWEAALVPRLPKKPFSQELSAKRSLPASYTAIPAAYPISVAGTAIENGREEYPFLELQGITYMPLTWHFVHDLLHLTMYWDKVNGLNVIGGQQMVLQLIVFDDADHLYVLAPRPVDQNRILRVRKTLDAKPVPLSQEETQTLLERMERQRLDDPYRGVAEEPDIREDGIYYKGLRLLEKADMDVPSNAGKVEYEEKVFALDGSRSLVAIEKRNFYTTAIMLRGYLYLVADGKATPLTDFPQVPAKVIPNADGSYWLATYGQSFHGHMMMDSFRLGHLAADNSFRVMNAEWNQLVVQVLDLGAPTFEAAFLGRGDPGVHMPLTSDGKLVVRLGEFPLDRERERAEPGLYTVGADGTLTPLGNPEHDAVKVYIGSDKQLYTLGTKVNVIRNLDSGQAAMWYDYELSGAE